MIKFVYDIFLFLFEAFSLLLYCKILFKPKFGKFINIFSFLIEHSILLLIYQYNITYLNVSLLFILHILLFKLIYDIKMKTAVFHSAIILLVMFATEIITINISSLLFENFNSFENNLKIYLFVITVSKVMYFSVIIILAKLFSNREDTSKPDKYFWLLFCIPFSSIVTICAFRYTTYQTELTDLMSNIWIIATILTLFSNVLVFLIYEFSIKNTKELFELKSLNQKQELDKQYFEIIEQSNNDMKVFSHNIKNHLTQIRNLDNINDIYEYVDKLSPDIEKFSQAGLSKNKMLDLILSKYQKLCDKKGITFNIDVKSSNLSFIDDVDLSALLNNLLDNALEAAEQSSDKNIDIIAFEKNKQYDGLIVRNSCDNKPKSINGNLITTKSDKELHGIGISSIKKVLKKYDAVFDWQYIEDKKIFQAEMAFSKK